MEFKELLQRGTTLRIREIKAMCLALGAILWMITNEHMSYLFIGLITVSSMHT